MSEDTMLVDASEFADVEGLFEDKQGQGGTYLSVFDFSVCQRSKSFATEEEARTALTAVQAVEQGWLGPHKRQNPKTKADVWSNSKPYDRMIGRIADIYKQSKEFDASKGGGKVTNWNIVLLTGGKRLTLQLTWIDHVLKRFLKVAPNINFRMPLLISAFKAMKNGDPKQAVSFRQYQGDPADRDAFRNVDKWEKVPEYWHAETGPNGERIEGAVYKGADGSILPPPIQDPEDDSWDYKAQNRFLATYFKDNILPQIKALAEQYGLNHEDTEQQAAAGDSLTHTGPPVDNTPVTEKPWDPVAKTMSDMISGAHTARIKQLAEALGMDPNAACQKVVAADLAELTDEAGRYIIYKMEQRMEKVPSAVIAPPPPVPTPAPVAPPADDDDDLWDTGTPAAATPPAAPAQPTSAPYDKNANDDIEW